MANQSQSMTPRPIDSCDRAITAARAMINSVTPGDLPKPTPCDEWSVRELIDHMSGVCFSHAEGLAGEDFDRDRLVALFGPDPIATFDVASKRVLAAYRAPDALKRELVMPWGTIPATTMVEFLILEMLLHTWDVATAIGRTLVMDEDVAAQALLVLQTMSEDQRQSLFAQSLDIAGGASAQDRLLAYSGRRPVDVMTP